MASRKTKKHRRRENRRIFEGFERHLSARALPQDTKAILRSGGALKMSEVLLDFIGPYMQGIESESELQCLVKMGQVAWNTALLPEVQREQAIQQIIDGGIRDGAEEFRQIVYEMIERKLRLFTQIERFVLGYDLTVTQNGPHLSVISTLVVTREDFES